MKKIDKLILSSFLGPFFLTFLVVVFILLTQHMLKYFDDIVGKDLGVEMLGQLFFYFAVFMTPIAIPLAVLLSSLMTFGNLGEHFELTAIKSAGISLTRALLPIFIFVLGLTVLAYYSNNYFVPKAALEAYSLLYDIKRTKPALDLKEGAFYNGIPDFSIKVNKKHSDGKTIEDVIIYDHRSKNGNRNVTLADSGAMYTVNNDRYLKLELFHGNSYEEGVEGAKSSTNQKETFRRTKFSRSELVLDLSSFALDRTDKDLFKGNRIMRNLSQLKYDVDSVQTDILEKKLQVYTEAPYTFYYHLRQDTLRMSPKLREYKVYKDSLKAQQKRIEQAQIEAERDSIKRNSPEVTIATPDKEIISDIVKPDMISDRSKNNAVKVKEKVQRREIKDIGIIDASGTPKLAGMREKKDAVTEIVKADTVKAKTKEEIVEELMADDSQDSKVIQTALNMARQGKSKLQTSNTRIERLIYDKNVFEVQWHKILANSMACIVMFLIGAPLGAIIKKGGLGIPVLISIIFFILFYVMSMVGEKWAKQDLIDPMIGIWSANAILLPVGLFFLRQARNDARLFDTDFYNVMIDRFLGWFNKLKKTKQDSL